MTTSLSSSNDPIRAVLYARSANEPHPGMASAVNRQLEELREFLKIHGWLNQGEYTDQGVSGLTLDRPGLLEVLKVCYQGETDIIVVTDMARITRDLTLLQSLLSQLSKRSIAILPVPHRNTPPLDALRRLNAYYSIQEETADSDLAAETPTAETVEPPMNLFQALQAYYRARQTSDFLTAEVIRQHYAGKYQDLFDGIDRLPEQNGFREEE